MDTAMADADAGNRGARGCSDEDPDGINFDHPDWQAQVVSALRDSLLESLLEQQVQLRQRRQDLQREMRALAREDRQRRHLLRQLSDLEIERRLHRPY